MKRRKLAILGSSSSVHVRRWAHECLNRNWDVSVISADAEDVEGTNCYKISPINRNIDWIFKFREVSKLLDSLSPDIVQAHYVSNYGLVTSTYKKAPVVLTAWGSDILISAKKSFLHRAAARWALSNASYITADSNLLIAEIDRLAPKVASEMITWGVDLARFHPASWATKRGFHVVSSRNWEPLYQIDVIIRALARVKMARPEAMVVLHLLGKGTQEAVLRQMVQDLNLTDSVIFDGFLNDSGMALVMNNAKLSISIPTSDSTSVALLESMACGLAVIASDLPANREWLDPSVLVPLNSPDALAEKWIAFLDGDLDAETHGRHNSAKIIEKANRQQQMDKVNDIYEQLMLKWKRS